MRRTGRYPWRLFWLLLASGLIGVAAVLPYVFAIFAKILARVPVPLPALLALQFMQSTILLGLAIGVGLLVAPKVGLGAPILEAWLYKQPADMRRAALGISALAGTAVGTLIVLLTYFVFLPHIPQLPLSAEAALPFWKRFLACFYGGLDEEILMRLFLLSLCLWLVTRWWRNAQGRPTSAAFWTVNIVIALLFGLGHMPAARQMMPITLLTVTYIISLNGIAALAFGYLYWKRGLESAIVAHFSADILLHVIAPLLLKSASA